MPKVHLMIGIQGSGKSTFSRILSSKNNIKIVSTDVVRQANPDWPEDKIWPEVYRLTSELIKNGQDVIFDATNITPKVRERFINNVLNYFDNYDIINSITNCTKDLPFELIGYFFNTDVNLCKLRVEKRNENPNELFLPPEVVYSYYERMVPPTYLEPFTLIYYVENNELILKRKDN